MKRRPGTSTAAVSMGQCGRSKQQNCRRPAFNGLPAGGMVPSREVQRVVEYRAIMKAALYCGGRVRAAAEGRRTKYASAAGVQKSVRVRGTARCAVTQFEGRNAADARAERANAGVMLHKWCGSVRGRWAARYRKRRARA